MERLSGSAAGAARIVHARSGPGSAEPPEWWPDLAADPVFADCPFGMAVLDPRARVLTANAALAALHGVVPQQLRGRASARFDGPLAHPEVQEVVRGCARTGQPSVHRVIRGDRRDSGTSYLCTFGVWPIRGADGVRGIGVTITDVSGDQAALTRLERARARLALVNEAELRMGFSQDVVGCAEQVPQVAVPSFADAAAIGLFDHPLPPSSVPENGFDPPPGTMMRIVAAALHPDRPPLRSLTPRDYAHPFPVTPESRAALRLQRAELSSTAPPPEGHGADGIGAGTGDVPPLRQYLLDEGLHSRIVAPLVARGRAIGVAMFGRLSGSPPFEADDVRTAEELGMRAAASIDNAQAHARQRQAVRTLQRHLLPRDLPVVGGLAFSYAYQPARTDRLAGGDWYDVIPLNAGRVALVVGDVTGHGLQAAALMGQLRVAVRAVARLGLPPSALLSHVDSLMDDFAVDGELASCVYAVYDTQRRVLTWARAGHPPPLLLSPGQPCRVLDAPPNALLGIGGIAFEQTSCTVPPGTSVVLYSDGLVERRGYDIDTGIKDLAGTLDAACTAAEGVPSPDRLRDAALRVLPSDPEDDVALLIAHLA
ncbi:GAF domain-containing SpoIIE family protein phosphatase [Yinghuangia soli]|uniref:protein-serine/threonine phosphatase n=1 Tax=Yinghuangia soli TaxID=2908204 RepID=A0AA41U1U6_9ACTN|nr:GAF domain-containing SpoIIE family protein phosphatase [Yinghuangia soli]MCF2527927.1 SpoIIE family protein phosphatase [Yinghuangia soli]